jgi:hypothetical protein
VSSSTSFLAAGRASSNGTFARIQRLVIVLSKPLRGARDNLVSYAYLLSGLCPHVRYAYFGQEFLSSKLANHNFTHENCGA